MYDFDMISVTPKDIQTKYAHLLMRFGMTDQAKQQIAMFRDPETMNLDAHKRPCIYEYIVNNAVVESETKQ